MTSLNKAHEKGKIEAFIEEHESDPDSDKLDAVIKLPS